METSKLPGKQETLVAVPQSLEIVVAENGGGPLTLILPPFDDINEIEGLKSLNFSLRDHVDLDRMNFEKSFSIEFNALQKKENRYGSSPALASRLATLAHYSGESEIEWEMLKRARSLSDEPFYAHRYGDGLIVNGDYDEAEKLYSSLDLETDVTSNLRLAYFCVAKRNFERAEKYVANALRIDPLDFSARLFDGGLHLILCNYERAIQSFRLAINERPGSAIAYCNIAIAYTGLKENLKALSSLKKAVAIDPLNKNALNFLSDISFSLEKDEEALPSLRYYVQFEQKNVAVWSRLARSAYRIGRTEEAVEALKRQASLESSGAVWNNLGVAYQALGLKTRAAESYAHGARIEYGKANKSYFLAYRNLLQLISSEGKTSKVLEIAPMVLSEDGRDTIPKDEQLADLVSIYIRALYNEGLYVQGDALVYRYLTTDGIADTLAVWLVGTLLSNKALRGNFEDIDLASPLNEHTIDRLGQHHKAAKQAYFNNVAFAFAEMGDVEHAEANISRIGTYIHHHAYPTATFGLIQFRKGNIERATSLYEQAIVLAQTKHDKVRIRQKLNLELGKHYLKDNESKGRRWLGRVTSERHGERQLVKHATEIVRSLSPNPKRG